MFSLASPRVERRCNFLLTYKCKSRPAKLGQATCHAVTRVTQFQNTEVSSLSTLDCNTIHLFRNGYTQLRFMRFIVVIVVNDRLQNRISMSVLSLSRVCDIDAMKLY